MDSPEFLVEEAVTKHKQMIKQMKGEYRTKDARLREKGEAAHKLLRRFGQWSLTWHPREESVALLGH